MSTGAALSPSADDVVVRRPAWLGVVANHALVLGSGWGACALALPESRRPTLVLETLGALAVVAALVTGWRIVGSVALLMVAATPLLAGALDEAAASTGRLVVATALLLLFVVGLDRVERRDPHVAAPVALQVTSPVRRWGVPLLAITATGLLGVVSTATITPSVAFVLLGVFAGVCAVLAATRVH